jgi:hypothetical protein
MIWIFWIFWTVLCGIIANNKNRNVIGWVLIGLIFGIFAVIILALLPKIEHESLKE